MLLNEFQMKKKGFFKGIKKLSKVNLKDPNCIHQLETIFNKFIGKIPTIYIKIPNNCALYRAVATPNTPFDAFNYMKYKPANMINTPFRASLAQKTAFYGSIINIEEITTSKNTTIDDINAFILCCAECSKNFRARTNGLHKNGKEYYTIAKFNNQKEINVFPIVHKSSFKESEEKNSYMCVIKTQLHQILEKKSRTDKKKIRALLKFFSGKYSEKINDNETFKYNLTAFFADNIMSNPQIDGVIYPSVRANGIYGMCVAINPIFVDSYFNQNIQHMDCTLYTYKNKFIVAGKCTSQLEICRTLGVEDPSMIP